MEAQDLGLVLEEINTLLQSGLETEWRDRAYTSDTVNKVVARLQDLAADDLAGKLKVSGFTLVPYVDENDDPNDSIAQACETCMYYEIHRQFCALPELMLPAKPEWSCILWRI